MKPLRVGDAVQQVMTKLMLEHKINSARRADRAVVNDAPTALARRRGHQRALEAGQCIVPDHGDGIIRDKSTNVCSGLAKRNG